MTKNPSPKQERPHRFRNSGAKRKTLELLAEYFCLKTNDVAGLLKLRTPTESDQRTARRTLSLLRAEGLVNRLPYYDLDQERGNITFVWGLSDNGLKEVVWETPKTFDEHSERTLDHELEISYFHVHLKTLALQTGQSLYWQQTDLKAKTIHPDALFALTDPKKAEGHNTHWYFLEIERSKIGHYRDGQPSVLKKLDRYYDYFNSADCEKEWQYFKTYRVITVQPTDTRRHNLLQALNEQHNHRMFWLTTQDFYKQDIQGNIFLTPKDYAERQYSFLDN